MLSDAQLRQLEAMVQEVSPDLEIETASLDAQQTLEVVLCREFICFRPLRISTVEADVVAALGGESEAQLALQNHLRTALQGFLS